MKQKIKEALKTRWGNQLGIKDEKVFEGVATSVQTLITSDEQLTQFVEGAKDLLTQHQSYADRVRTELNAKIKGLEGEKADLEAKLNGGEPSEPQPQPQPQPEPQPQPKPQPQPLDMDALVEKLNATWEQKLQPLQEKLSAFEAAQSQKSAVAALDELKNSWDYAKGYPEESEDAYERVMELYEVGGKKWTADELTDRFKEKFNKAVSKKGVDTSKPFPSDGGNKKDSYDFSKEKELLRAEGVELPE